MKYQFPHNCHAKKASLAEQAQKVIEEAYELLEAIEKEESDYVILEEAADIHQALEGVYRKYDDSSVDSAISSVLIKSRRRDDYVF